MYIMQLDRSRAPSVVHLTSLRSFSVEGIPCIAYFLFLIILFIPIRISAKVNGNFPPDVPRNLTAAASGRTQINLTWNVPASDGGTQITGYRIEFTTDPPADEQNPSRTQTWTDADSNTGVADRTYSHTDLRGGVTYYYRVYAINTEGESDPSAVASGTTHAITVPNAPTGLKATVSSHTQIGLSWVAPSDEGGAAIHGYQIEVSVNAGDTWAYVTRNTASTITRYLHINLTPGKTYHYRVSAINSVGTGDPSNVANATTDLASRPGIIIDLSATASGRTQINLSWTAPKDDGGADISEYQILMSTDLTAGQPNLIGSTGNAATTYSHANLRGGTTYHYWVRAVNSVGAGPPSNRANATTDPPTRTDAPTELRATASGPTQINLSWTAPKDDGGADISGYEIVVFTDSRRAWTQLSQNATTAYSHKNLTSETTYYYVVRAINSAGVSLPSNRASATTNPASRPGNPTGLSATASGPTQINLSWTAPKDDGGADIGGYEILLSTNAGREWTVLVENTGNAFTTYSHTNLKPETTYHYFVRAVNSVGASLPSNISSATTNSASKPGRPTGLGATVSGREQINLSWTAPKDDGGAAIRGYRIEISANTGNTWTDLVANTGGGIGISSYAHTELQPGTTHHYRVSAINSVGIGNPSNVVNATTDAAERPDAPTGLRAVASGRTQINLSWTAPTDDGGAAIQGYRIQVSTNAGATWANLITNVTGTSYTHTGLQAETTRHYRVSAINSIGTSDPSSVTNATTDAAVRPERVTDLSAQSKGYTQIILSWAAPANDGGAAIRGYRIEESMNSGNIWTDLVTNTGNTGTTYEHMGLQPGTTRHYRVYAINSVGESTSASNVANTTTDTAVRPDAPTGLSATVSEHDHVKLSWTAPSGNGGAVITGYRIEISSNAGTLWTNLVMNTENTATTYTHTDLTPGTTHHYRVYAINSIGVSDPSNVVIATVGATTRPDAPTRLSAQASGRTQIHLSWNAPADNGGVSIAGYRIQVSTDSGTLWTDLAANTESIGTTYRHTGLQPGTTRHYRVFSINSIGESTDPSNVASATTVLTSRPGVPTNLVAQASGHTEIHLSWNAPVNNGGSAIVGYRIQVSSSAGSTWSDLAKNTESALMTYRHMGLQSGTTHHYRVFSINSIGESTDPSNVASATTVLISRPGVPTNLVAQASGHTQINLSWNPPSDNGGTDIRGYRIEVSSDAGGTWSDLVENTGSRITAHTHTKLMSGVTRHYRVYAINSVGESTSASNVSSATTAAATRPGAPMGLSAKALKQREIHLSWSAPTSDGGASITGYRIQVSVDGGAIWSDVVANTRSAATTYTHTGLIPGTSLHYRVYAINSIGESITASNVVNATLDVTAKPGAPTGLSATASGRTQINLSWNAPPDNGGAAIIGYRIQVSFDTGSNWVNLVENTGSTATTYTHTGLQNGTTYYYRVYAINSIGESTNHSNVANSATNAISVPDAPRGLTATASGETEINLSWRAPSDNGGTAIGGYQIEVSTNAGEIWSNLIANTESTAMTYTHMSLQPGTTRHYRVRAINEIGTSTPSNTAHATTEIISKPPDVPTNVKAMADGQNTIHLSWSAPLEDGGSPVIGYQVDVSEDMGATWDKLADDVTGTTYLHAELPSGVTRHYRVSARNAVGIGMPSMVVHATTDEDEMTSIESWEESIPSDFSLEQNYPNPFNPSTAIEFSLSKTERVTLIVYNLLGQKVRVLADGIQPAGRHRVLFIGSGLSSDTYIYILQTEEQRAVKMMTLLR